MELPRNAFPSWMRFEWIRSVLLCAAICLGLGTAGDGTADPIFDSPPPKQHAESPKFAALWSTRADTARVGKIDDPSSPPSLTGLRLADVTIASLDGQDFFTGFYLPGTAEIELKVDLERPVFLDEVEAQAARQRCLSGFEMRSVGGKIRYSGVFQGPCNPKTPDVIKTELALGDFSRLHGNLSPTHRLVDLETVFVDGFVRIGALWKEGSTGEEQVLVGLTWPSFDALAHQMTHEGYELLDIDIQAKPWESLLGRPPWLAERFAGSADPARSGGGPAGPADFTSGSPEVSRCELPGQAVFSGLWRRGEGSDWLGVGYHGSGVDCAVKMFAAGHGKSGVTQEGLGSCGQDDPEPLPGGEPLGLRLVESYFGAELPLDLLFARSLPVSIKDKDVVIRSHFGLLHDSGTADPP